MKSLQWRAEVTCLATEEDAVVPGYDRHSLSFRVIDKKSINLNEEV